VSLRVSSAVATKAAASGFRAKVKTEAQGQGPAAPPGAQIAIKIMAYEDRWRALSRKGLEKP
jgi:hypothetical protein